MVTKIQSRRHLILLFVVGCSAPSAINGANGARPIAAATSPSPGAQA